VDAANGGLFNRFIVIVEEGKEVGADAEADTYVGQTADYSIICKKASEEIVIQPKRIFDFNRRYAEQICGQSSTASNGR
jgi:hypothetical protein